MATTHRPLGWCVIMLYGLSLVHQRMVNRGAMSLTPRTQPRDVCGRRSPARAVQVERV